MDKETNFWTLYIQDLLEFHCMIGLESTLMALENCFDVEIICHYILSSTVYLYFE